MVGAFLRTFFEGLDIKCSLAAYALLNDRDGEGYGMEKKRLPVRPIALGLAAALGRGGALAPDVLVAYEHGAATGGDGGISGAADAYGLSDGERQTG